VDDDCQPTTVPERLAAAWPPDRWHGVHVLTAVSGGADSMALLRALLAAKSGGAGQVFAAHVNHRLRGRESDDDETWLGDQCRALGVPLLVRRIEPKLSVPKSGDGREGRSRAARYKLLVQMADEAGARFVAVAHTQDDQVETVLFRLLRGTGPRGLAGIPAARPLSPSVTLVRPLLACTRSELRAFLASLGQAWREDATNADLEFRRNRVRNELLPYLREHFNPTVDAAVARAAKLTGESQALVELQAEALIQQCGMAAETSPPAAKFALDVVPLANQPELLVCEALRAAWRRAGWPEQAMSSVAWRRLALLVRERASGAAVTLPEGIQAEREGDRLLLTLAVRPAPPSILTD
jgi:tRNA(Ile)-lysidine synthase